MKRHTNIRKSLLIVVATLIVSCADLGNAQTTVEIPASISDKVNYYAVHALDEPNYSESDDIVKLYGVRTNGADTRQGNWACAKVATIVLKKAGVLKRVFLGVRQVESKLKSKGWEKIEDEDELEPGDVIVWVSKTGREDKKCTGGGNCHVGIVTTKGYFHNSPISNKPQFGGFFSLFGFDFKVGFRAPN
jgi:hypothetical protein